MDQRAAERAGQSTIQLSEDRKETDRRLRNFIRMLNALATVDDDEDRFYAIISKMNEDQAEWKQRYEDYRRSAKRVSVKSKVVGNHLYSTSRDWTWSRLIDDGKALLAIDDEQADRIISTDKKALKAGGLYLALNGVKVKPGDYIDIEKEYELLAFDDQEGGEVTPVTPE